jgi:hypothetical protein
MCEYEQYASGFWLLEHTGLHIMTKPHICPGQNVPAAVAAAADLRCAGLTAVLNFAVTFSEGGGSKTLAALGKQLIQQGAGEDHCCLQECNIVSTLQLQIFLG